MRVSTSGTDADFIVKLIDVFPDNPPRRRRRSRGRRGRGGDQRMRNYQMLVGAEVFRAKYRRSYIERRSQWCRIR